MSIYGKINLFMRDIPQPGVNILFCGYAEEFSPDQWYHPNRMTPFWRFYWGASEGANLVFKDARLALDPRSVVFVPPDIPFGTEADKPFSQLFIHFEWPAGPALDKPVILSAADESDFLRSSRSWYETAVESVSLHMYSLLFRYLPRLRELESKNPKKIDLRIERALRLMGDGERDISLTEIAKEVSMSYDHFLDVFTKQVGISPGRYRMTQRMNYAQFLLLHSTWSMEEIAQEIGFANRFHFSKAFKQFFKQPPGKYRKKRDHSPLPPEKIFFGSEKQSAKGRKNKSAMSNAIILERTTPDPS